MLRRHASEACFGGMLWRHALEACSRECLQTKRCTLGTAVFSLATPPVEICPRLIGWPYPLTSRQSRIIMPRGNAVGRDRWQDQRAFGRSVLPVCCRDARILDGSTVEGGNTLASCDDLCTCLCTCLYTHLGTGPCAGLCRCLCTCPCRCLCTYLCTCRCSYENILSSHMPVHMAMPLHCNCIVLICSFVRACVHACVPMCVRAHRDNLRMR